MSSSTRASGSPAPLIVWWVVWFAILGGLMGLYFVLEGKRSPALHGGVVLEYVGLLPLAISCVLRWLVLPKTTVRPAAFVVFIAGVTLAEGCGILGLFLSERSGEFVALGVLGILQWVPTFARRFHGEALGGRVTPR